MDTKSKAIFNQPTKISKAKFAPEKKTAEVLEKNSEKKTRSKFMVTQDAASHKHTKNLYSFVGNVVQVDKRQNEYKTTRLPFT